MEKLKSWLNKNERSGSWLARKCGVSPVAVKYWFDGTTSPTFENRKKIHKLTGIKI